ncbi:MAG: lycopene cyclase family protein [Ilumatobacteraceae bacterium]
MSDSRYDADLVIAGAGCSGLSALWHALHSAGRDRRIVVVDRDFEPVDDRTWAFWGTRSSPFAELADRTWDQVQVRFPGWESTQRIGGPGPSQGRVYLRVRRRDYDCAILEEARCRPNVRFVAQDIVGIHDDGTAGVVRLPEGELRAPVVLQSARLSPAAGDAPVRHPLRQHFGGWEVRTERPVFDPSVVTLMDFDTRQQGATSFFYLLPVQRDRALVEHTMFSAEPRSTDFHDHQVRVRLDELGAGEVVVERREYGAIPMEDRAFTQRWGDHVWNIGTVGGMTKPTTGYTFQRTHAQTRHLVDAWASGRTLTPLAAAPTRFALADRVLLNILHHHPEQGRPVFERLFRTAAIDDVLTFLDEDSTLAADARLMSRLPWPPFVRAAASELAAGTTSALRRRLAR